MKALIIEDSVDVMEAVSLCFQLRWPEISISTAAEGEKGLVMLETEAFDIVILDINLPGIDGFEVLKRLRSFSNVPVIALTVRGSQEDQVRGLEMGADDYIVKPFKPRDLVARVNAVLRRSHVSDSSTEATVVRGKLTLNLTANEIRIRGETTKLTPIECKVLYVLMVNAEQMLESDKLLREVWGEEYNDTNLLRTYIRKLRAKLKDNPPQIILNQRGEGYKLVIPT